MCRAEDYAVVYRRPSLLIRFSLKRPQQHSRNSQPSLVIRNAKQRQHNVTESTSLLKLSEQWLLYQRLFATKPYLQGASRGLLHGF